MFGLPWKFSGKESTCSARATRDTGSIPVSERSPGGGYATQSSILIPWTEEPGSYSPWGCKELDTTE